MTAKTCKVEYIFLCQSIKTFNQDLEKLAKLMKDFNAAEKSMIHQLLETTKENIQYIERKKPI